MNAPIPLGVFVAIGLVPTEDTPPKKELYDFYIS
jgi:hypothetical protein